MRRSAWIFACWVLLAGLLGCDWLGERDAVRPEVPTVSVQTFTPQGRVQATQSIRVVFSEPVVRPERIAQAQEADDVLVVQPELGGRGRWVTPHIFEMEPDRALAANTRYSVRVRERTVGPSRRMVGARRFSFYTPLFRVISADTVRVDQSLQVAVELSHAVRSDDAVGAITLRDADGRVLPARLLGEGLQHILRFALPADGFDPEEGVQLRVEPTLVPDCGGMALDKAVLMSLSFEPPNSVEARGADATSSPEGASIRVRLNVNVDPKMAAGFVTVDPPSKVTLHSAHRGLLVKADLQPGQLYRVLLREGMPTAVGPLDRDIELEARMPTMKSSLRFEPEGPFLSATAEALSVAAVNVARLKVRALRIPDRNIAHVDLSMQRESSSLGTLVAEVSLTGSNVQDAWSRVDIPLSALMKGGPGLYRIEVQDVDRGWVRSRGWLMQRDLLITAKSGVDYLRARVVGAGGAKPIYGAQVSAYSRTGRRLFAVRSDAQGVAEYRGPLDAEDPVAWLVARKDKRSAYLPMASTRVPLGGQSAVVDAPAFVWTARDYFRPGERVHAFAVADASLAGARWELSGPEGPLSEPVEGQLDALGLARVNMELPDAAEPGAYVLRLLQPNGGALGASAIRVIDLEPSALQVELTAPEAPAPRAALPFSVRVASRFGGRPAGLKVEGRCRYTAVPVVAADVRGFTFGADSEAAFAGTEAELKPVELDAQGRASLSCPPPSAATPAGHRVQVELRASVHEPGAKAVTAVAQVMADVISEYVGLRHRGGQLQALAVSPSGRAISDVPLAARVWALGEPDAEGAQAPRGLVRVEAKSEAQPVVLAFQAPRAGRYRAEVEAQSGSPTSLDFWVLTGTAASSLPHVEVTLPERSTPVGAKVSAQVDLPFPGRLRVTVERDRVLYTQVFEGASRTMRIQIPVLPAFAPNAQVVVQLEGAQGRAYGAAPLYVADMGRRLKVQVELPKGATEGRFPITIKATGVRGPARAIVTVVPQERWGMHGDQRRDPAAHFEQVRGVAMSTHDPLRLSAAPRVAEQLDLRVREPTAPAAPQRRPASSLAFVSEPVKISARGFGWLAARMPAGGGPKRITVTVFDGYAVGVGHLELDRGGGPLLNLRAPQALVSRDRVQVPLTIENPGRRALTVTASAAVQGPLRIAGAPQVRVTVPPGQARSVDFTVEALQAGQGAFRATVTGRSAASQASAEVIVRPATAPDVRGAVSVAKHNAVAQLALPAKLDPSTAQARLTVGAGHLHQYLPAFDALYYSALQAPSTATARALALMAAPEFAPDEGPGARAELLRDIAVVSAAMDAEGRISLWPGGPVALGDQAVQAGLLMAEGRRSGLVQSLVWNRVQRAMQNVLRSDGSDEVRAMAAYALTRAGIRAVRIPARLSAPGGSPTTRALVAASLLGSGRTTAGRALLSGEFGPADTAAHTAWTLLALASTAPRHGSVVPLLQALQSSAQDGRWQTLQANAVGLMALRAVDRSRPAGRPYWGSILANGQRLKRFNSTRTSVIASPASAWRGGLQLSVTGAGVAQTSLSLRGSSQPAGSAVQQGLEVRRRHLQPTSGEKASTSTALGALWAAEIEVRAVRPDAHGGTLVRIPIPSGFILEQVWPTEVPGLVVPATGVVEQARGGLRWWVDLRDAPARLTFTMRAVRPGRFQGAPVEAWHVAEPALQGRTAPLQWTVQP